MLLLVYNIERVRDLVLAWRSIIPNNKTGLNKHAAQMKQLGCRIILIRFVDTVL